MPMPPLKRAPDRSYLSEGEMDIAARLRSYQRKISSLQAAPSRKAGDHALRPSKPSRERTRRMRSEAEEYRSARRTQRLVWVVCAAQMLILASLPALHLLSPLLLAPLLLADGCGLAASFVSVQRREQLCVVLNALYLIGSTGFLVRVALLLLSDSHASAFSPFGNCTGNTSFPIGCPGNSSTPAAGLQEDEAVGSSPILAAATLANMIGGVLAAFVIARPLSLHRYESVAMDEEAADARAERSHCMGSIGPYCDTESVVSEPPDEEELQPIEAWVNAGEVGMPLVFMPVKHKFIPAPSPAPATASACCTPLLPPPPSGAPPASISAPPSSSSAPAAMLPTESAEPFEQHASRLLTYGDVIPKVDATAMDSSEDEETQEGGEMGSVAVKASGEAYSGFEEDSGEGHGDQARACQQSKQNKEDPPCADEQVKSDEEVRIEEAQEGEHPDEDVQAEVEEQKEEESEEEGEEDGEEDGEKDGEEASTLGSLKEKWRLGVAGLREFKQMGVSSLKEAAVDALKQVADGKVYTADELIERAKILNREGKFKRACEAIEEAYALEPKTSTAISAANLRLKMGEPAKAAAAYRRVVALAKVPDGPNERELEMAKAKLREAEEQLREASIKISFVTRKGEPRSLDWFVSQLKDLSEELFSESATLYSEHGVALQDGFREIVRLIQANRLLAAGQVLRPVEKLITKACLSPRDEQERRWLTTARTVLNDLRVRCNETQVALKEFDEASSVGWRVGQESPGLRTEWRPAEDGSVWVRMEGALSGTDLTHAVAVAHEVEHWPKWVPLCSSSQLLSKLGKFENVAWLQFDLPVMKRGAIIQWSLTDSLLERRSLLLLGVSVDEAFVERPPAAANTTIAHFRAIKVLLRPSTRTSARIFCVANVDLKANVPQSMMSIVTKKVAGAILSQLMREAQRVTKDSSDESGADQNPWLQRIAENHEFYRVIRNNFDQYFDLYGEDDSET